MYTLLRNLLVVVALVGVAIVLVRTANRADGPAIPTAAIPGGRASNATSKKDQELPPRVLHESLATQERDSGPPETSLEGSAYRGIAPAVSSLPPVPNPNLLEPFPGNKPPVRETPTGATVEAYPLPTVAKRPETAPQEATPDFAPQQGASSEVTASSDAVGQPTRHSTAQVITGPEDSFWSISAEAYGSGNYYRALFRHNRGAVLRPDQLKAGIKIEVPTLQELRALYPQDCPQDGQDG